MASLKLLLYSLLCDPSARSRTNLKKTNSDCVFIHNSHKMLDFSFESLCRAFLANAHRRETENSEEMKKNRETFCRVEKTTSITMNEWRCFFIILSRHWRATAESSIVAVHRIEANERWEDEGKARACGTKTKSSSGTHYLRQSRKSCLVNESIKWSERERDGEKSFEGKNECHSRWWLLIVCYL